MKSKQYPLLISLTILLVLLAGCGPTPGQIDAQALEQTAQAHLTSVAYLNQTAQIIVKQTEEILPSPPPTQTYEATITKRPLTLIPTTPGPSPTITEALTPSTTPSPTPLAQAIVIGDTNCRTGPSKSYPFVGLVAAGTKVDIVGRDIAGYYYVIRNPFEEGVCWLWSYFTDVIGSISDLPKFAAPPTPRPTSTPRNTSVPNFRLYEEGLIECGGVDSLVIRVSNYSREGFSSWRARVFSPGYVHQGTYMMNQFSHASDDCEHTIGFLPYRITGFAIFPIDLSYGDTYLIEFEACTLNNKLGACAFEGIYVEKEDLVGTATPRPLTKVKAGP